MSDPTSLERQPRGPQQPQATPGGPVDLDRVAPPSDASAFFFEIRMPGREAPVRIEYAAIRDLHRQLAGEGESVGVLLGSSSPDAISIQRCEPLALPPATFADPKALPGAFRQLIRTRLQTTLEGAPQMLGCFRTQIGGWPGMKDSDLEIAKRNFPGTESLFLQIRTTRQRPWLASLYALDEKTTTSPGQPVLEFPFDEYLLRNGYLTDLVETPQIAEAPPQPIPIWKNKTVIVGAALAAIVVVATAAGVYKYSSRPANQAEVAGKSTSAGGALNLKVNRSGKDFEVSWDRLSTAVQQSSNGMLTISDGALTRTVALSGPQLREGRILYTPLFEELTFRLEVAMPDQSFAAESVQVLAWSGKQPSSSLAVTPPDPVTNSPARIITTDATKPPVPAPQTKPPVSLPVPATPAPVASAKASPPNTNPVNTSSLNKSSVNKSSVNTSPVNTSPVTTTKQAKAPAAPETARVIQPSPTPSAAVVSERPPAVPAPAPSTQPPAATAKPEAPKQEATKQEAPKQEAAPARQILTPAPVKPTVTTPAPTVAATSATPSISTVAVPIDRPAPLVPRNLITVAPGFPTIKAISIRAMIDSAGSVQSVQLISSTPKGVFGETLVQKAALDAAKQWKFKPAQQNGKNVASEYTIDFKFQ